MIWNHTRITIAATGGHEIVDAETHPDAPGLAVQTAHPVVTHVASGRAVCSCPDLATARWAALALAADGLSWRVSAEAMTGHHTSRAHLIMDRVDRIPPAPGAPPLPGDALVLQLAGVLYLDAIRRMAASPDYSYVCGPHTPTWEAIVHLRAALAGTSYPEAEDWLRALRCKDESEVERLRREVTRD